MKTYERAKLIWCDFDLHYFLTRDDTEGTLKMDLDNRYVSFECDETEITLEDISSASFEFSCITITSSSGYTYCFELPNPEYNEEDEELKFIVETKKEG